MFCLEKYLASEQVAKATKIADNYLYYMLLVFITYIFIKSLSVRKLTVLFVRGDNN